MFCEVTLPKCLLLGALLLCSELNDVRGAGYDAMSMEGCGRSLNIYTGEKIVGGRPALVGEYPWQLGLEMRLMPIFTDYQFICGASLINKDWAVTAAHCIVGGQFSSYRVIAGAMNMTRKEKEKERETSRTSVHPVLMPYVHEGYNPLSSLSNDIALLRLAKPVEMNSDENERYTYGVCLPTSSECKREGMATASGWGATKQGGSVSSQLMSVDVPIVSHEECKKAYGKSLDENMICAGHEEGGKDSCQGDSGGPLIQRGEDGTATLIGVVSWGEGCAQPEKYGVYTCTASFMDWMQNKMQSYP